LIMAVDLLARLRAATLQMLLPAIDTELRVVGRRIMAARRAARRSAEMPGGARNGRPRPSGAPWIIRTFWDLRPFARELQQDFRNDICGFESSQPGTIRLLPPVMNGIMTDEDLNFIGPIAPVKLFSGREGRCSAKLLFGNFKFIGTMFRIVF
jgi:hypothetical protein